MDEAVTIVRNDAKKNPDCSWTFLQGSGAWKKHWDFVSETKTGKV